MSSLTWLDFSDAERRRALEVLDLLSADETRDELGVGTIRDAFAEAMFPGISTIQRRARYFLFVPWTFREIERRYRGRPGAVDHARWRELRMIDALLESPDQDGVIGARARRQLQQVPSMIYWQGLGRWGIRRIEGTREQWARAVLRSGEPAWDDDGQLVERNSWWHEALPAPPEDWPDHAELTLRPAEAAYLRERIRQTCADTLLATLVEREQPWAPVSFPWQLGSADVPAAQQRLVAFARRFSETMHGAALLYNHMLAVAREDESREAEYRAALEAWAAAETGASRADTPLPELWERLAAVGSRHRPQTRQFVEEWFRLAEDPRSVEQNSRARDLIRGRERDVKHRQARLSYDAALETWRGAAGAGQLSFRWPSAQRQMLDIIRAGAE
jgi:Family of unknown function (DUF6361)